VLRSKRTQRIRLSRKTSRLVQSAVQRALRATTASSARTNRMIAAPTSGRKVSSERSGKPAAFISGGRA
jgi:hypothetical protein